MINNLVYDKNDVQTKIRQITNYEYLAYVTLENNFHAPMTIDIRPIPITEAWLLSLGFEYNEHGLLYTHTNRINMMQSVDRVGVIFYHVDNHFSEGHVAHALYVHTFQNLYFWLNEKELKLDETIKKQSEQ
jgi:hypothetical protein